MYKRQLLQDHGFGKFRPTIAGQAWELWKKKYMPPHSLAKTENKIDQRLEREAFHGARIEVLNDYRSAPRLWLFDVNALYPHVMNKNAYPVQPQHMYVGRLPHKTELADQEHVGMVDVTLTTTAPVLPHVDDGLLLFPVGTFRGCFTWPELRTHWHLLADIQIHHSYTYRYADIFGSWAHDMWALRQKYIYINDPVSAEGIKLLMNTLFGKFAQRKQKWVDVGDTKMPHGSEWATHYRPDFELGKERAWHGRIQRWEVGGDTSQSRPLIAAHIAAHARIHMWKLMELAGMTNVYRVHTDSLMVNEEGAERLKHLVDPTKLGWLKEEWSERAVKIYGVDHIEYAQGRKLAGVAKEAEEISPGVYKQITYNGWTPAMGHGNPRQVIRSERITRKSKD